jgi:hypothetical protein
LIFPRRANFDKKNPNRFLFSCANSGEKFVATLFGPAVSIILKFCLQNSNPFLFFNRRTTRRRRAANEGSQREIFMGQALSAEDGVTCPSLICVAPAKITPAPGRSAALAQASPERQLRGGVIHGFCHRGRQKGTQLFSFRPALCFGLFSLFVFAVMTAGRLSAVGLVHEASNPNQVDRRSVFARPGTRTGSPGVWPRGQP